MNVKEYRHNPGKLEVRDEGQGRVIIGYAAVFNSLSQDLGGFRETIRPGAFTASLKTADIRALIDHEPCKILGRTKSGTLQVAEDDHGLKVEIRIPATTDASNLLISMGRGDIDGMSFGFRKIKDNWKSEDGQTIRELLVVDCFDVSVVTYPAYLDTEVAIRSLNEWKQTQGTPLLDRAKLRLKLASYKK